MKNKMIKYIVSGCMLAAGGLSQVFAQAGDGSLAEATNTAAAVSVASGVANSGVSVFYVVLPAGLIIGLSIWGYMKFKKVAK